MGSAQSNDDVPPQADFPFMNTVAYILIGVASSVLLTASVVVSIRRYRKSHPKKIERFLKIFCPE